jgi:hypothetical protein
LDFIHLCLVWRYDPYANFLLCPHKLCHTKKITYMYGRVRKNSLIMWDKRLYHIRVLMYSNKSSQMVTTYHIMGLFGNINICETVW